MIRKKIVVGITHPSSVILLEGQLAYFYGKGYDTYLLAPDHDKTRAFCAAEGCSLLPTPIERDISIWKDIKSLLYTIKHFKSVRPDIVNVGTPKMGLVGILAAFLTRVPNRIYTCRGFRFEHERGFKRWVLIMMEKVTGFFANQVICISPSVKKMGCALDIFPESKVIVLGKGSSNGININKFNRKSISFPYQLELSQQLKLDGKFIFGFVGRLVDRKGVSELFNAFENLYKERQDIRLLIVGPVEETQLRDKTLVVRMQEHIGVIMVGMQVNIPLYLSLMDVFVLPAWWEGFGNVLIQAAAMGLPVISTLATGTQDAVSNGYNGLLVTPNSVDELTWAMKKLMLDNSMRSEMGKNGLQWATYFTSDIIWDGLEQLYKK